MISWEAAKYNHYQTHQSTTDWDRRGKCAGVNYWVYTGILLRLLNCWWKRIVYIRSLAQIILMSWPKYRILYSHRHVVHFTIVSCTCSTASAASAAVCISSEWVSSRLYSVSPERSQTKPKPGIGSRGHPSHEHSYYNQTRKMLSQPFLRKGHVRIYPLFVFWQKMRGKLKCFTFPWGWTGDPRRMHLVMQMDSFQSWDLQQTKALSIPSQSSTSCSNFPPFPGHLPHFWTFTSKTRGLFKTPLYTWNKTLKLHMALPT